jgi:hypothetical protein
MLFQALSIVVALACVVGVGSRIQGYRARDIQRVTPSALRKPEFRWHRVQLLVRFTFLIAWLSLFLAVVGVLPALGKSALIGASALVGTLAVGWSLLALFPRRTIGIANNLALAVCSLVIALMWVMPLVNASSARVSLSLPVDAPLLVFQGGRTPLTNHHYLTPGQRHALDLVALDGSGVAIDEQRPEGNAQVFGYGLPVVAPISGEIALVKEGYSDEKGDVSNPAGNHVVIRTEAGVFVLMAHLKHESITVKSGQRVATGDQIGQLGNSGNSSMPHLHIQVQDAANLDQVKETFPIEFTDSNVRGRAPSRGDTLTGGTHPTKQ